MGKRTLFWMGIALCVAANLAGRNARAGDVRPLNLHEMTARAGKIFEGACLETQVERDQATGLLITVSTFEVRDWLKGSGGKQIQVRQYGGILPGGSGIVVAGMPRYAVGERVILFLHSPGRTGFTSPVGLMQGKFALVAKADGSGYRVLNHLGNHGLFQGMSARELLGQDKAAASEQKASAITREASSQETTMRSAMARAMASGQKGPDLDDFKTLVRRLVETPFSAVPTASASSPGGGVGVPKVSVRRTEGSR